ncbi:MAG TPA: hypothetical protein VKA15_25335 [Isosphaeraceae bacterium]|nr:hypothetical protein [Isosphaeraceae bacterium]
MAWKPPVPLVTTDGKIELTISEIEAVNAWLDGHKQWLERHQGRNEHRPMCEEITADVLRRLLGHALGSMSPKQGLHREKVTIEWRRDANLYHARVKGEDLEFQGMSPDEAVGWLIREAVLGGRCLTVIDIESDGGSSE